MTGEDLINAARAYLGVPFRHAGRSMEGIDCVGILACAAHDIGMTDYDDTDYGRWVIPEKLRATIERFGDPLPADAGLLPGDVLTFKIAGVAQHIALWTGAGIIHAYQSAGVVAEHPLDAHWVKRLVQAYRLRDLQPSGAAPVVLPEPTEASEAAAGEPRRPCGSCGEVRWHP